jgi:hypothetical protein
MSTSRKNKSFDKFAIYNYLTAIALTVMVISVPFLLPRAFAQTEEEIKLTLRTSQQIYVSGEILEVFGTSEPNQVIVIRLYDPVGLAIRIDNAQVNEDGIFRKDMLVWPEPSRNLVFGTYTIEALSSSDGVEPIRAEVTFAGGLEQGVDPSRAHVLEVKLDTPNQITVNSPFRIFVQVTFDGALVDTADEAVAALLGTSHIHSSNSTVVLSDKFRKLHPGIYFADIALGSEGTYIIHTSSFYRGFLSHDTRLISVTSSSIATLQESVDQLNAGIDSTNEELDRLQEGLQETRSALNETKATVTQSSETIGKQIGEAQAASGQINSLILPVLALISVIIALQISLFARIRASYR